MIRFIAKKYLGRKLKRLKRRIAAINLSNAKTALLVYDASQASTEKRVRDYARFLKEEGVKCDTIGYYKLKSKEDQRPQDELGYYYFDKTSVNKWGFPNESRVLKRISTAYHILIDLNTDELFCLQVISSLSQANFKVGLANGYQNEVCDLTISADKKGMDYFLSQVTTYLKMINKK